jgi:transcription initiation factor TFIIIB Brf1 subunit/transcription initiation factor TFIIB
MKCDLCNSTQFREERGVVYCEACGYVIQETYISYAPTYYNPEPTRNQKVTLTEKQRIRNLTKKYSQASNATLHQTLVMLGEYCNNYELPYYIKYNAFNLYKKLYNQHKTHIIKQKEILLKSLLYLSACNYGHYIHPKKLFGKTWRKQYSSIKKIKKELNITIKYDVIDIIHYIVNTIPGNEQEKQNLLYTALQYYQISKYKGNAPHKIAINILKTVIKQKNLKTIQITKIEKAIYGTNRKNHTIQKTLNQYQTFQE